MKRIALVTCEKLPEPDPDRELLRDTLNARGADATWVAWSDASADWSSYDLVVPRSTWDYIHHLEAFLGWMDGVTAVTRLMNPVDVMRSNVHKRYLAELTGRGVHAAPTELLARGTRADLSALMSERSWPDVVVKPAVSAGSFGTRRVRVDADELEGGAAFLASMLKERDMMVQPYVPSVETHGERSMVFIDGAFTHVMRKTPRFTGEDEKVMGPYPPDAAELELATAALSPVADRILYGRVDVARDSDGSPMVMELELIEPSLFLLEHPPALERFVSALLA